MLAELRAAVTTVAQTVSDDVWPELPGDPNVLPCIVIGLPSLAPESETVFDARVDVYVIAERTGGPGTEAELIELTDLVLAAYGGSTGHNTAKDTPPGEVGVIAVDSARPTRLEIGGQQYPAYVLTVAASLGDC